MKKLKLFVILLLIFLLIVNSLSVFAEGESPTTPKIYATDASVSAGSIVEIYIYASIHFTLNF